MRDVIVVGAGAIGCAIAQRLAAGGRRVLVLDAGATRRRATGAAGGVLGAQSTARAPGPLFDLAMRSLALYQPLADELRAETGIDIGLRRTGVIELVFDEREDAVAAARMQWQRARELPVERLDAVGREIAEPDLAPDVLWAYHYPNDAQVDPRLLVAALEQSAVARGAEIRSGAPVQSVIVEGGKVRGVQTNGATIEAATVVLCAGAWSSRLGGVGLPIGTIAAVRGQVIELEQNPPPLRTIVTSSRGTLVPRPDGRILCGWTTEHVGDDDSPSVDGMLQILEGARAMVPAIVQARLRDVWAGLRPATGDELPLLGGGHAVGLEFAVAHDLTGVLLAPVLAEVIAGRVLGGASTVEIGPFSPVRFAA